MPCMCRKFLVQWWIHDEPTPCCSARMTLSTRPRRNVPRTKRTMKRSMNDKRSLPARARSGRRAASSLIAGCSPLEHAAQRSEPARGAPAEREARPERGGAGVVVAALAREQEHDARDERGCPDPDADVADDVAVLGGVVLGLLVVDVSLAVGDRRREIARRRVVGIEQVIGGVELFARVALGARVDGQVSDAAAGDQRARADTDEAPGAVEAHVLVVSGAALGRGLEPTGEHVALARLERDVALERHETSGFDAHVVRTLR